MKLYKVFSVMVLVVMILASCAPAASTTVVPTVAASATTAPTKAAETAAPQPTDTAAPQPTDTAVPPTATQGKPKIATFIWNQEYDSLNPLYTQMWFSSVTQQLWSCWTWNFDDTGNPVPIMVTEIPSPQNGDISADGKTVTIKLRQDMKWSDGTPITADDFVFTYKMTIDPKNTVATTHPYELVESVTAPDKYTVVTTFKDPFAPWLYQLWHGILPAHILQPIYDKDGTLDNADWNKNPTVGCGPYNFEKWESGGYALFSANDNYWLGRPKIDQIFFRFVPDAASEVAAMVNGEGDLGTFPSYSDIPKLQQANIAVKAVFSGYNEGLFFNLDPKLGNPALQDVNVRKAIAMAIDRFSLNKDLLLGLTVPAATDYDNTPYVDPSIKPYPFDPAGAKTLLDNAGWVVGADGIRAKNGVKLSLKFGTTTREIRQDTQAVIQQQLKAVGIDVVLSNYASDVFFSGFDKQGPAATGQLDMWEYSDSPAAPPDPDMSEYLCDQIPTANSPSGSNWERICDPALDQLFKDQISQTDVAQRQATFQKITKMIFDKAYWIGLWQDPDQWLIGKRLTGVKLSGTTPFYNIMDWDLTP